MEYYKRNGFKTIWFASHLDFVWVWSNNHWIYSCSITGDYTSDYLSECVETNRLELIINGIPEFEEKNLKRRVYENRIRERRKSKE